LIKAHYFSRQICTLALLVCCISASADDLLLNFGGGPQPGSDQTNSTAGIDFVFFSHERSKRSSFDIGVSYTYMSTNTAQNDSIIAYSVFPQLSMYPSPDSWFRTLLPSTTEPYFFVRALGPSYISDNRLGDRQQDKNFAFQAQIGLGAIIPLKNGNEAIVTFSWKHFSNANLFDDNDGIDFPFVLTLGLRF